MAVLFSPSHSPNSWWSQDFHRILDCFRCCSGGLDLNIGLTQQYDAHLALTAWTCCLYPRKNPPCIFLQNNPPKNAQMRRFWPKGRCLAAEGGLKILSRHQGFSFFCCKAHETWKLTFPATVRAKIAPRKSLRANKCWTHVGAFTTCDEETAGVSSAARENVHHCTDDIRVY